MKAAFVVLGCLVGVILGQNSYGDYDSCKGRCGNYNNALAVSQDCVSCHRQECNNAAYADYKTTYPDWGRWCQNVETCQATISSNRATCSAAFTRGVGWSDPSCTQISNCICAGTSYCNDY